MIFFKKMFSKTLSEPYDGINVDTFQIFKKNIFLFFNNLNTNHLQLNIYSLNQEIFFDKFKTSYPDHVVKKIFNL